MSADEARRYAFAGGAPLLTIIEDHQISNSERFVGATAKTYEGALIDKDQLLGTSMRTVPIVHLLHWLLWL